MCLAVPGKIESIDETDALMRPARVSFGGVTRSVSLAYTPDAQIGDYVVVHVGFAISRLNEHEAQRIFKTLEQVDLS